MKKTLIALTLGTSILVSGATQAALISASDGSLVSDLDTTPSLVFEINSFGRMEAAYNFIVNGLLYDVVFRDTTVGFANDNRIANNQQEATEFAQAIIDQVLVDGPAGSFDSDFTLIEGCQEFANVERCGLAVPFGLFEDIRSGFSFGFDYKIMDAKSTDGDFDIFGDPEEPTLREYNESAWQNRALSDAFSLFADIGIAPSRTTTTTGGEPSVSVSEPAGAALMVIGAFSLMFLRRKKK